MEKLHNQIIKDFSKTGSILVGKKIDEYCMWILPKIAFYFYVTFGFPYEMFKEEFDNMNKLEQLSFIFNQVKKKHYLV